MHYPNGGMEELTASPLYHTVTIINSNTHSGGVSLHLTKKRIVYNFRSTFFAGMREITYKWYVSKEKKLIDAFRLLFQWWFGELEKLIIRKKCIIAKLITYSSGCIFPKGSKRIGILFIPRHFINPKYDCYKWRYVII